MSDLWQPRDEKKVEAIDLEWNRRAATIGAAITQAFPCDVMSEETLNRIIGELAPPKNGLLSKIAVFFDDSFNWNDDELLEFVKILADSNWLQIDWNEHWQVVPLFTEPVLAYCLPGLMNAIVSDAFDCSGVAAETLLSFFLYPAVVQSDRTRLNITTFSPEQLRVIAEFVKALRDLMFFDNPLPQTMADEILHCLCGESSPKP
jgi:hypothetical protein